MIKTYCGKTCEQCQDKQLGYCIGCTIDSEKEKGKSNSCNVARCCVEKQHSSCWKCGDRSFCTTYFGVISPYASMLGKWIFILLLLIVPSLVASVMTSDSMVSLIPSIELPGIIVGIVSELIYGLVLLKLATANSSYKMAGILYIVVQIIAIGCYVIEEVSIWSTVLSLVMAVVALISEYCEINAHSAVLTDIDDDLAAKWNCLWYWNIAMITALIIGTLLIFVMAALGVLLVLASVIMSIVIGILKLVYLYRTANMFKSISETLI